MRRNLFFLFIFIIFTNVFSINYVKLSEVKRGMTGIGYTVYSGSTPEKFTVKILGIVRDPAPKRRIIIARLIGKKQEKYGIFAGMSGSPVFVNGKILGAIAYGFTFSAEPICGITPFEDMLKIGNVHLVPGTKNKITNKKVLKEIYDQILNFKWDNKLNEEIFKYLRPLRKEIGGMYPIPTPVYFPSKDIIDYDISNILYNQFNMVPVDEVKVKIAKESTNKQYIPRPGDSIVAALTDGDFSLAAGGTLTYVDGKKFWAFGHPFEETGKCDMNLYSSDVVTVLKNLNNSFKLFTLGNHIGRVNFDETTGISGIFGEKANTLPATLKLTLDGKIVGNYKFNIMRNPIFTPFLYTIAIQNTLISYYRLYGDTTIKLSEDIDVVNHPSVHFENYLYGNMNIAKGVAQFLALPIYFLNFSGFENVKLKKISTEIDLYSKREIATIDKIWVNKKGVFPGDDVKLHIEYLLNKSKRIIRNYDFYIPEEITPGNLKVYIGDGGNLMKLDSEIEPDINTISTLGQLIKLLNDVKENNKLYVKIYRKGNGILIGGKPLMAIPYSYDKLLTSNKVFFNIEKIKNIHYVESNFDPENFLIKGYKIFNFKVKNPKEVK